MKPTVRLAAAAALAVFVSSCESNPGSRDGGPLVGTVNVNGTVMNTGGKSLPNATLVIKSGTTFSTTTRTDANGDFAVANVPTPYDVAVIASGVPNGAATVSIGMTSVTPTVLDMFSWGPPSSYAPGSASLSGAVSGGIGFPTPQGYRTAVLFASPDVQTGQSLVADSSTGDFSEDSLAFNVSAASVDCGVPPTTTGTLHALQWQQTNVYDSLMHVYTPSTYAGYGFTENISLSSGTKAIGQDIAMTAVTSATFGGSYTPPTGYTLQERLVALNFDSGGLMLIVDDTADTEAFSYATPNISGATLIMANTASNGAAYSAAFSRGLAVNATGVSATSPAAAELNLPLDGATGVTSATPFSWAAVPGVVHLVVVSSGDPSISDLGPSYIFLTTGTSVTIPDLTSTRFRNLPASAPYTWAVYGLGPYADVEAAGIGLSGAHLFSYLNTIGGVWVNSDIGGFETASPTRSFTTAP